MGIDTLNDTHAAIYASIENRLRTLQQRYLLLSVAGAAAYALVAFLFAFLLAAAVETNVYAPPQAKALMLFGCVIFAAAVFSAVVLYKYLTRPDLEEAARLLERAHPGSRQRIISAVQLGRGDEGSLHGQSPALVGALLRSVDSELAQMDIRPAVPVTTLHHPLRASYAAVLLGLLVIVVSPGRYADGLGRFMDIGGGYTRPVSSLISITTTTTHVVQGDDYRTAGFVAGGGVETLSLYYRWENDAAWTEKRVDVDPRTGDFTAVIEQPRATFTYYLESADASSARNRIRLIERPAVESIGFELTYPDYTGLGTSVLDSGDGSLRAVAGTNVRMTVTANKPLASMSVHWSDSTATVCEVEDVRGTAAFEVDESRDYYIALRDTLGIANAYPIVYRLTALEDTPPAAVILSPPAEVSVSATREVPVHYHVEDDYGIGEVSLVYSLSYEEQEHRLSVPGDGAGVASENMYRWNLNGLGLLPEDAVSYYIEVYDNDVVNGPKRGRSDTHTIHMPSPADMMRDITRENDEGMDRLRGMSERTDETASRLEDVQKNIINRDPDWSDRNAIENSIRDVESMQNDAAELSEQIQEASRELSEEDLATIETMEKFAAISEMLDELRDGEMKEALKHLMSAQQEMDPAKLKEALDNYTVSAEQIKKRLDRIIKLLEQANTLQRFESARALLENIAIKQAEINARLKNLESTSQDIREQQRLAREMNDLEQELDELAGDLKEQFGLNTEELEKQLENGDISGSMESTAGEMEEGNTGKASDSADETNTMLSELLEKVDAMGSAMENSTSAEMKRRLFTALHSLLGVADKQERVMAGADKRNQTAHNEHESEMIAEQEMDAVEALTIARADVNAFTEVLFQVSGMLDTILSNADVAMQQAVDAFATGSVRTGRAHAYNALRSVNQAAHFLTTMLQQGDGSGQGMPGDMLQQLQNIANGELSLQQQMQGAGQEQLMQLAAEQQKLAEMLSELGKKVQQDPQLRDLMTKLAEEMDDTASMMERNEPRELVERRQLDIYRRLLDARRSRREKEEPRNERQSWTAERDVSEGAEELDPTLGERMPDLNQRIQSALEEDIAPEYRSLIRRYFESLLQDYPAAEVR